MRKIKNVLKSSHTRDYIREFLLPLFFILLIVICCCLSNGYNGRNKTLIHNLAAIGIHISAVLAFELIKKRKLPKKKIQKVAILYGATKDNQLVSAGNQLKEIINKQKRAKSNQTISFTSIPANLTRQEATRFISSNKEQFDHFIWYDLQPISNSKGEKFMVRRREISSDSLSNDFAPSANLEERSLAKIDFREVLAFDLGLYCLSSENNFTALSLLKEIYTYRSQNKKAKLAKKEVKARSRASKPSFLAAKLRVLVSKPYNQLLKDNDSIYNIRAVFDGCEHALKMLGTTAAGSLILSQMVVTSCRLGCFADAKAYCARLQEVAETNTFELILGDLIHAILEGKPDNLLKICNKIKTESDFAIADQIIPFLSTFTLRDDSQKRLMNYAMAALTAKHAHKKDNEPIPNTLNQEISTVQ